MYVSEKQKKLGDMAKIEDPGKKKLIRDKDLHSKMHDEILLWLYRNVAGLIGGTGDRIWRKEYVKRRIEKAQDSIFEVVNALKSGLDTTKTIKRNHYNPCVPQNSQEVEWLKKQIHFYESFVNNIETLSNHLGTAPNFPGVIIDKIIVQSPIHERARKRNYESQETKIVGFIDMEAQIYNPELKIEGIRSGLHKNTKIWKSPIIKFSVLFNQIPTTWYFDVRTSVDNLGAMMREIEVLKKSLEIDGQQSGYYAVVAPHTELSSELLANQGITVIKYDPEIEFNKEEFPKIDSIQQRFDSDFDSSYEILPYPTFLLNEFDEEIEEFDDDEN